MWFLIMNELRLHNAASVDLTDALRHLVLYFLLVYVTLTFACHTLGLLCTLVRFLFLFTAPSALSDLDVCSLHALLRY
jgi:hypothetical protein